MAGDLTGLMFLDLTGLLAGDLTGLMLLSKYLFPFNFDFRFVLDLL